MSLAMTKEISTSILVVVLGAIAFWLKRTYGEKRTVLKNGRVLVRPARLPFIGILGKIGTGNIINVFQDQINKYGPLVEIYMGTRRVILMADAECAKELLLSRPKCFQRTKMFDYAVNVANVPKALLFAHGNVWNQARRFTAPSFNKQNVNGHAKSIWTEVNSWTSQLIANQADGKTSFEFKEEAFLYTLRLITKAGFGIDSSDSKSYFNQKIFQEDILSLFTFVVQTIVFPLPRFLWKYFPQYRYEIAAKEANERFSKACLEQIYAKRKELQQGTSTTSSHGAAPTMLETLLRKEEGEMLSDQDVLQNVKIFYLAGSETTSISISYAMYFMSFMSDILHRVRAEGDTFYALIEEGKIQIDIDEITRLLPYTEAVLKESIRLCGPVTLLTHALDDSLESYTFSNGIELKKGDDASAFLDGILHNAEYFEDPWTYNPDRWLDPNEEKRQRCEANLMAFGYGPRTCPGMRLAMVEGTLALLSLVHRLDFKLGCDPKEVTRIMLFTSVPDKVPLIMSPRKLN